MVSSNSALVVVAAAIGMLQMCPAPQAVVAAVLGGVAAGAVGGGATLCARYCPGPHGRNFIAAALAARDLPPGVSQQSIDQCTQQLNDQNGKGIHTVISDVSEGSVLVTNVPPACMDLATVLTGNPAQAGGPVPVPMSSSSLQYNNLSGQDRQNLANALGGRFQ